MPVPAVSPKNWERTTIICHFIMATPVSVVSELSFQDRLDTILNHGKNFTQKAKQNEQEATRTDYKTHSDFQATRRSPYRKQIVVRREKPHRPRVDDSIVARLHGTVRKEKPSVPAERLDFDDNLGILLDAAERYYSTLQCQIRETKS